MDVGSEPVKLTQQAPPSIHHAVSFADPVCSVMSITELVLKWVTIRERKSYVTLPMITILSVDCTV